MDTPELSMILTISRLLRLLEKYSIFYKTSLIDTFKRLHFS